MGFFDGENTRRVDFLEEERAKLWDRLIGAEETIESLRKEIETRTPDAEKEAKSHSKKAAEYRNRAEDRLNEADDLLKELNTKIEQANLSIEKSRAHVNEISDASASVLEKRARIEDIETDYLQKLKGLLARIEEVDTVYEKYPDIGESIEEIHEFIDTVEENAKKSAVTLGSINNKKKEIDDLHRQLFGYVDRGEDGKEVKIDGVKQGLERTYSELASNIEEAQQNLRGLQEDYRGKFEEFSTDHATKYGETLREIETLLPGAMTAGLSSAFADKKSQEETNAKDLQRSFIIGIIGLSLVSLLPVGASIYFLAEGYAFERVVIDFAPRFVLAFFPVYVPILWFTYSANKKYNLSKRLIEEYAHKEVLSKTYQGLAKQITGLDNSSESEELRFKLLSNFLQATSENPGKLISNYQVSDHPIMEALEQSYKFEVAVQKLEAIPGIGNIAKMLKRRTSKNLDEKSKMITKSVEATEAKQDNEVA